MQAFYFENQKFYGEGKKKNFGYVTVNGVNSNRTVTNSANSYENS